MPTLLEQRSFLAQMLDIYHTGTIATAGDNWVSAPYFSARSWHDGALDGAYLNVYSGTNAPLVDDAEVMEHNAQTGTLAMVEYISPSAAGKTFEVFQRYGRRELDFALMQSIMDWRVIHDVTVSNDQRKIQLTGAAGQPGEDLTRREQVHRVWLESIAKDIDLAPRQYTRFELMEDAGVLYLENRDHLWNNAWYNEGLLRIEYSSRYPRLDDNGIPRNDSVFGGDLMNTAMRAKAQLYNRKLQTAVGPTFQMYANLYRDTVEQIANDPTPDREPAVSIITTRWV